MPVAARVIYSRVMQMQNALGLCNFRAENGECKIVKMTNNCISSEDNGVMYGGDYTPYKKQISTYLKKQHLESLSNIICIHLIVNKHLLAQ